MNDKSKILYKEISADILKLMDDGKLLDGDRIPSKSEIAEKYSVSAATALKVLNEIAGSGRVRKVPGKGYFVREAHSSRPLKRTGVIGCILRPVRPTTSYDNYFNEITSGIHQECMSTGYRLLFSHISSPWLNLNFDKDIVDEFNSAVSAMSELVDGFLIDEFVPDKVIANAGLEKPAVIVNRTSELKIDTVSADNECGSRDAALYALKTDYTSFIIACSEGINYRERARGFKNSLLESGIDPGRILEFGVNQFDRENFFTFFKGLFEKQKALFPDSRHMLFSTNDHFARFAVKEISKNGVSVPDELGIIGFEGLESSFNEKPRLSTMKINAEELGRTAFKVMLGILNGALHETAWKHRVKVTLAVGETL